MKGRAKVVLNGLTTPELAAAEDPLGAPPTNQALHVLTMAQRTAEEHVRIAHQQADKIRADALAAAEQIARDADTHAQNVRREAETALAEARAAAERAIREAQTRVEEAQRNAEGITAQARAQAEAIAVNAEQNAEELQQQARRRYDDVVGSLATRREGLQQQIEALERFDREYRARLTSFMQNQLRALWVDQPQVTGELDEPDAELPAEPVPAEQPEPGTPSGFVPAPRRRRAEHSAEPEHEPVPADA
ncbi:hypothetical protein HC030_18210 [Planosporangium mesophilum]|nr:hypothetical protein [Planosporangium mesophilum]NJC84479.1 hypothetical protein [Planosporangium mesophilum]